MRGVCLCEGVALSEAPGAPAGVWGPSRRGGAVVTSPFFILGRGHKHRRPDVHGVSYSARMGNTRWVYPDSVAPFCLLLLTFS